MEYTIGTLIPAGEVLKRYKDEDDDTFLEVKGGEGVLYRVSKEDRVYYKIEKSRVNDEDLILIVDYTRIRRDPVPVPESVPEPDIEILTEALRVPSREGPGDDTLDGITAEGMLIKGSPLPGKSKTGKRPANRKEIYEGQIVPIPLRDRCIPNEYDGYSLRYEKYLYLTDKNYRVEIKTLDSGSDYKLEEERPLVLEIDTMEPCETGDTQDTPPENESDIVLDMGDVLPFHLRYLCEAELSSNYGSRILLGDYLYLLDAGYRITRKMKVDYEDNGMNAAPAQGDGRARKPHPTHETQQKHEPQLSDRQVADNLVNLFESALEKYNISADYFKESVLGPGNREVLVRAYNGDLTGLNHDTREAADRGETTVLKEDEAGFPLFKAVLIHELYINSTVGGRRDNMKYLLTHIAAAQPDGTVGPLQEDIATEDQEKIMAFFEKQARVYTDKTEIIKRVHRKERRRIIEEYKEMWLSKQDILFRALLITKLYEHTTRMDRGDGLTMIRLARDIIQYRGE